jgi:hypothetical protein
MLVTWRSIQPCSPVRDIGAEWRPLQTPADSATASSAHYGIRHADQSVLVESDRVRTPNMRHPTRIGQCPPRSSCGSRVAYSSIAGTNRQRAALPTRQGGGAKTGVGVTSTGASPRDHQVRRRRFHRSPAIGSPPRRIPVMKESSVMGGRLPGRHTDCSQY